MLLLVEDHAILARSIARAMRPHGLELRHCASVEDACAAARAALDGVILDEFLPDGRGSDFLRCLRKEQPHLPALLMSATFDQGLVRRAQTLNAFYTPKPFEPQALRSFVDHVRWAAPHARCQRVLSAACRHWRLTKKQSQIVELAVLGVQQRADLAEMLSVEEETVKTHITHILKKTGYSTLRDLVLAIYKTAQCLCTLADLYRCRPVHE